MLLATLITVIVFSLYFYFTIHSANADAIKSLGKCVPMVLGMTSSVTVGLVIGVWIADFFAIATIVSIILSCCLSLLFVKRFGMNGMIEALAASFMGAMMGAMMGVMLTSQVEMIIALIAFNVFFMTSVYVVIALLHKAAGKKMQWFIRSKEFYVLTVLCVSLISGMGIFQFTIANDNPDRADVDQQGYEHSH
ncbi:hypothetical protein SFC66_14365 [Terribacillus saccharophilus]|uniref:hypothetical protein n=1 Tax=Terribacillus saccharophilus TaxID=361277 RepID=UPI003982491E